MSETRKLRPHKGWVFDPQIGAFCRLATGAYHANAYVALSVDLGLGDDDHAPLMDLKKNPYEPVVTLEDVVRTFVGEWERSSWNTDTSTMVLSERIRAAFPHIDTSEGT